MVDFVKWALATARSSARSSATRRCRLNVVKLELAALAKIKIELGLVGRRQAP